MPNLLKSMLQTGLYLLDNPDRAADVVRERIKEGVDWVGHGIRGEDHTLGYVLTFAVGVGVGLGVGILTAPASGEENRRAIVGTVRRAREKAKRPTSPENNIGAAG